RIEEKGSFASGSAQLTWEFEGLLLDMAEVLADMPGDLAIEGHTDNVPIRTERFYSNWDLSAARAAAVANVLLAREQVTPDRIRVTVLADTKPRVANTSPEHRAKNRLVAIVIDHLELMSDLKLRLRELIRFETGANEATIGVGAGQYTSCQISW